MTVDFRYRQLGYVALQVSDLARSTDFCTQVFGLDFVEDGPAGERFFRVGQAHHDLVLTQGPAPAFVRSSWELETEGDLELAFAHYERLGLAPRWVPDGEVASLRLARAFRIVEPVNRTTVEYFADMTKIVTPPTNRLTSFHGGKHFGLCVPDNRAVTSFMTENMGFVVSDYLETWQISLMRAFPNPNHHSFAPVQTPARTLAFHHVAFMVNEIDDIGKLFNRVKRFNVKTQFGIGRHPTSGSIHLYIYDEDFLVWEYTLGMEQFPERGARQARRMSAAPENLDLWGAVPDREFAGRAAAVMVS
jgi:2,3-dihydroxy-p-cumate/2,3-dihydroxybenzoate 3,4-dioxygenase